MTETSSEMLQLLHELDVAQLGELPVEAWERLVPRIDAVLAELVALSDHRFHRDFPQDSESFAHVTKSTADKEPRVAFSLHFSLWGNLTALFVDENVSDEGDQSAIDGCQEILERHGFVLVSSELLESPYPGSVYDSAHIPDNATWYWRFFEWH